MFSRARPSGSRQGAPALLLAAGHSVLLLMAGCAGGLFIGVSGAVVMRHHPGVLHRLKQALTADAPTASAAVAGPAAPESVTVTVNMAARHPISRFIYGMNFATDGGTAVSTGPWYGALPPREVTLNRLGGNRLTAYNWVNNYSNAGNDFNYQNDDYLVASTQPGEAIRFRAAISFSREQAVMVTIPMIGYVAADGDRKRMEQLDVDRTERLAEHFRISVPAKGAAFTLSPDPKDKRVYQDEFVNWLIHTFPRTRADSLAPIFYCLDNEPDAWHSTHKEIMSDSGDNSNTPRLQTYDGFADRTLAYARAIKAVDPNALVFGPGVATYAGVLTLGRYPKPDPVYGNRSFVEVYLDRMRAAEKAGGRRLLDVLDVHWYPQATTKSGGPTNDWSPEPDPEIDRLRLDAPRSLWDASYDDHSWVTSAAGGPVRLLRRLKEVIAAHYPGTRLSISEYWFGGGGNITGGLAEADALGVFGREGLFAAALWPTANVFAPRYDGSGIKAYAYIFGAYKAFLDYDGNGGRFGDIGVETTTTDSADASVYGSIDQKGRPVFVIINKQDRPRVINIAITGTGALHTAKPYTVTNGLPIPEPQPEFPVGSNNAIRYLMPPLSITTLAVSP